MKKITKLLFFIATMFYSSQVFSLTTISSLPYTCSTPGETYILSSDLTLNSGNAITISANNIKLNGNGKTITYANTGAGYGIFINVNVTSLEIYNLTITQGSYEPIATERVHGIIRDGSYSGIKIYNNTINIKHGGSIANSYGHGISLVNSTNSPSGNEIYSNTINITGTSGGRGINIDPSASTTTTWSGKIYNNTVTLSNLWSVPAGYPRAISLAGNGNVTAEVFQNTVTVDQNCDTAQGISLWKSKKYIIRDNSITLAGNHSRALILDGDSDYNKVYRNKINLIGTQATGDASAGILIRFGSDYNQIYLNSIDASTAAYSFPIRLGKGDATHNVPTGNIVHNNTLTSSSRALSIESNSDTDFYWNKIKAIGSGTAVFFYCDGIDPCNNITFSGDTISGDTTSKVEFTGIGGQIGSSNITFCNTDITESNVKKGAGTFNYQITSSGCKYTTNKLLSPPTAQ